CLLSCGLGDVDNRQEVQCYQALNDQVRRDLATARLDAGAANFAELALELGFADGSAFHKAFKKWTGSTPGQYRAQVAAETASAESSGVLSETLGRR
ncbi:helix-turn-helix domain-containing protein, partial [Pseudomonas aeruginosa]